MYPRAHKSWYLSTIKQELFSLLSVAVYGTSNEQQAARTHHLHLESRITVFGTVGGSNDGRQQQPVDRMLYQRRMDLWEAFSTHLIYESRKSSLLRKLWSEACWNGSYNDLELYKWTGSITLETIFSNWHEWHVLTRIWWLHMTWLLALGARPCDMIRDERPVNYDLSFPRWMIQPCCNAWHEICLCRSMNEMERIYW